MPYTINQLAKMAGVSTRTLRYYDECGLLPSQRNSANGYRIYDQPDVDRLQQILFYRELGVGLEEIARIISATDYDPLAALSSHLLVLQEKREKLGVLIQNVEQSIKAMKGEIAMSDNEKFEGLKQQLIEDNEQRYGAEIRAKYGDDTVERSNAKLKGLSEQQYAELEQLTEELKKTLKAAFEQGDPTGELAQDACRLHKEWLCFWWAEGTYSKEAHLAMGQMYLDDTRFTAYYDAIAPGLAFFLADALAVYCK